MLKFILKNPVPEKISWGLDKKKNVAKNDWFSGKLSVFVQGFF